MVEFFYGGLIFLLMYKPYGPLIKITAAKNGKAVFGGWVFSMLYLKNTFDKAEYICNLKILQKYKTTRNLIKRTPILL